MNKGKHNPDIVSIQKEAIRISKWLNAPVIPVSFSKKPYTTGWSKLSPEKSITTKNLMKFKPPYLNIGVVLGNGIVTIDCDDDDFQFEMLRLNPCLANTLISQGSLIGGNFWIRVEGECPGPQSLECFETDVGLRSANGVRWGIARYFPVTTPNLG